MKSMGLVEKVPSNLTKSTKSTLYLCYAHMEYDMYKVLKVGRYRLAFDSFPFTAREISNVYLPHVFGYQTRKDTRNFDPDSKNGKLIIAVCEKILIDLAHKESS